MSQHETASLRLLRERLEAVYAGEASAAGDDGTYLLGCGLIAVADQLASLAHFIENGLSEIDDSITNVVHELSGRTDDTIGDDDDVRINGRDIARIDLVLDAARALVGAIQSHGTEGFFIRGQWGGQYVALRDALAGLSHDGVDGGGA